MCLYLPAAKSEASIILAAKQAAFIKNPAYNYADGSGPEIVTVGHNPYEPDLSLARHIVLSQGATAAPIAAPAPAAAAAAAASGDAQKAMDGSTRGAVQLIDDHHHDDDDNSSEASVEYTGGGYHDSSAHRRNYGNGNDNHARKAALQKGKPRYIGRRKFVDEYLYDRLFLAQRPFTTSILRTLRQSFEQQCSVVRTGLSASLHGSVHQHHHRRRTSTLFSDASLSSSRSGPAAAVTAAMASTSAQHVSSGNELITDHLMPHGVHHIDPSILERSETIESSVFADFVAANHDMLNRKVLQRGIVKQKQKSYDPAVRLAFSAKLDPQTRQIQDLQVAVQQFYECRIASLERFLAFCVMFHAMAEKSCKPWFSSPWDIARSQSNLRVATTGACVRDCLRRQTTVALTTAMQPFLITIV